MDMSAARNGGPELQPGGGRSAGGLRSLALALACALFTHAAVAQGSDRLRPEVLLDTDPWPIDAFSFTDHDGAEFTDRDLDHSWSFVVFGGSTLTAPTDELLRTLARVSTILGTRAVSRHTRMLWVAPDPQADTPLRLRRLLSAYDERLLGLHGSPTQVRAFAHAVGVADRPVDTGPAVADQGLIEPGASIQLIGPDRVLRAQFLPPFDARIVAATYLKMRTCWPRALLPSGRCAARTDGEASAGVRR